MDLEIARLRRDLRRVLSRKGSDLFGVLGRLRTSRDQRGDALLAGFAELGDRYDPEALHALRRQARRLRYMSEVHDLLVRDEPSEAGALFKSPAGWRRKGPPRWRAAAPPMRRRRSRSRRPSMRWATSSTSGCWRAGRERR